MSDREKILAEVERLRKKNEVFDDKEYAQYELDVSCGYDSALEDILSFINSIPEEPVSEDLEEASMTYAQEVICKGEETLRKQYKERYGLDLGEAIVSPDLDKEIANHFKNGAKWQKEQMMANTADAMIGLPYENKDGGYTHLIDVSKPLPVGNNKIAIIFKEN